MKHTTKPDRKLKNGDYRLEAEATFPCGATTLPWHRLPADDPRSPAFKAGAIPALLFLAFGLMLAFTAVCWAQVPEADDQAMTAPLMLASMVQVVLFGGSDIATTYLPEDSKLHTVLERELAKAYPEQAIKVSNFADNGEFIARYLLRGTYEKHRKSVSGIDVAIIRFGGNDIKYMDKAEYRSHMEKFIELLKKDFPGIQIILETGMYLDYPAHHINDRNKKLNPVYQVSRDIAARDGYPLVEYYETVKAETAAGNWDVRVRARPNKRGPFVLDASQDAGKENDPKWFTDIHPNPEGVKIAVREEVRTLKKAFPEALPSGQKPLTREARDADSYAKYLDFPPERLKKPSESPDQLQKATK